MPSGKQLARPAQGVLGPGGCSCRGAVSPAQATEARFQGAQPLPVLLQGPHPARTSPASLAAPSRPGGLSDCSAFKGTEGWVAG